MLRNRYTMAMKSLDAGEEVIVHGIQQNPMPTLKQKKYMDGAVKYIVLKVPGQSYWSARGEKGYAPATYEVYEVMEEKFDSQNKAVMLVVESIIDFPVR